MVDNQLRENECTCDQQGLCLIADSPNLYLFLRYPNINRPWWSYIWFRVLPILLGRHMWKWNALNSKPNVTIKCRIYSPSWCILMIDLFFFTLYYIFQKKSAFIMFGTISTMDKYVVPKKINISNSKYGSLFFTDIITYSKNDCMFFPTKVFFRCSNLFSFLEV